MYELFNYTTTAGNLLLGEFQERHVYVALIICKEPWVYVGVSTSPRIRFHSNNSTGERNQILYWSYYSCLPSSNQSWELSWHTLARPCPQRTFFFRDCHVKYINIIAFTFKFPTNLMVRKKETEFYPWFYFGEINCTSLYALRLIKVSRIKI